MNKAAIIAFIENIKKPQAEDVIKLLQELRCGRYYSASGIRSYMIASYKDLINLLSPEEYEKYKIFFLQEISKLISERQNRKIAYSLLSDIICFSCINDFSIYSFYENEIFKLANNNKNKYFHHLLTLAKTKNRLFDDISNIEDFFIQKYLKPSRINSVNLKYLNDFTINIPSVNKRKLLFHLFKLRPFFGDTWFIKKYILNHPDLDKYSILL